jgi:RNA polymerase sigma-70 factor (ECF subfamily)
MGMSPAYSFNIRPTARAPRIPGKARRRGRIEPRVSSRQDSERAIASPKIGNEWALVQQAIAGNCEAQEHLFSSHLKRLYRTAFALLHNREDAEDALQNGLLSAYANLRCFKGRSSFSTWLTRIVINSALMARRKNRTHAEASLDEIMEDRPERVLNGVVDMRPDPEKSCAVNEVDAILQKQVLTLSPPLRAAFRLRAIDGLSTAESCRVLGVAPSAFKSRICRVRQKLAARLPQSLDVSQSI